MAAVAQQGHSVDEYLETIYFLAFPIGEYRPMAEGLPTVAVRVAEMLGVSRASAGEMLKRLETEGLIERGEHKEALLTKTGRARAEKVVRKHRLIERLLTDFMGYTAAEAHVHADELGDTFSDDMVDRIAEKLGQPERCPHGWPVDPEFEQRENDELAPLAHLDPGTKATIVRLAEHDGDLLHWFYDQGLEPGRELEVRSTEPFAVQLNGGEARPERQGRRGPLRPPGCLGRHVDELDGDAREAERLEQPDQHQARVSLRAGDHVRALLGRRPQLVLREHVELLLARRVVLEDRGHAIDQAAVAVVDVAARRVDACREDLRVRQLEAHCAPVVRDAAPRHPRAR